MRIRLFLSLLLSVLLLSGCGYNQIQINDEGVPLCQDRCPLNPT